jgi:hypothetical protein
LEKSALMFGQLETAGSYAMDLLFELFEFDTAGAGPITSVRHGVDGCVSRLVASVR